MSSATWETVLRDFRGPLAPASPLVFVLGAGCSLSSGGPTTFGVFKALDSQLGRVGEKQRSFAADQSPSEKRQLLAPKFTGFAPGIGYQLLASLAHTRPVYVVNFNWDAGVETAAQEQGVPCEAFEPEQASWDAVRIPDGDTGLRVIHVHGSLTGNPLARLTETCHFPAALNDTLDNLWAHQKVCVGVDLGYELDFFNFLDTRKAGEDRPKPWYFSRGESAEKDGHIEKLERMGSLNRVSVTPHFDFDLFMVELAGQLRGKPYATFAADYPELLPPLNQLCLPDNKALMPLVAANLVCLAAEPHAGASTLALLVVYLRKLLAQTEVKLELAEGVTAVKASLGNSAASAASGDSGTFFVADRLPLAAAGGDATLLELCRLLAERHFAGAIVVVPLEVVARVRAGENAVVLANFGVTMDVRDGAPYTAWELKSLAARLGCTSGFLDAIDHGLVKNVAQVRENRIEPLPRDDKPGAMAELEHNLALRSFAMCARLLELSAREKTVAELERLVGAAIGTIGHSLLARYVSVYKFENVRWFQVAQDKRQLLDALLATEAQSLRNRLHGTDVSLLFELEQWLLFRAAARNEPSEVPGTVQPEYFRRMTSTLLEEEWSIGNLDALLKHSCIDAWGATNVAYALVAGWESFPLVDRRRVLTDLLANRALRGCYAVVEAALFFGAATPKRLWAALQTACWELIEDAPDSEEVALVVDAFMWRPPLDERANWMEFISLFFDAIDRKNAQGGALRVYAAYHPVGLTALYPDWHAKSVKLVNNEAQAKRAAWLIEWHFVHRTMSRAVGYRFGRNDKDMLCRELHTGRVESVVDAERSLLEGLVNHQESAGWGFHAAALLGGKSAWLTDTEEGRKYFIDLLASSEASDAGVATGFAGYAAPRRIQKVREALARDEARGKSLIAAVENGVVLEGLSFSQEQFPFVHDVDGLWRVLGVKTPNVDREGLKQPELFGQFMQAVEASAGDTEPVNMHRAARVVEGLRRGSRLGSLEQAIPARDLKDGNVAKHAYEVLLVMAEDGERERKNAEQVQLRLL